MQNVSQAQQQQAGRDAYGKLLEGLGPDYEPFKQMFNAGASIHDVAGAMGGPIGQQLIARHYADETAKIFNSDLPQVEKLTRYGALTNDWNPYIQFTRDASKPQKPTLDQNLEAIQETLDHQPNLPPADRALGESAVRTRNPALADEFMSKALPKTYALSADQELNPQAQAAVKGDPEFQQWLKQNQAVMGEKPADQIKEYFRQKRLTPSDVTALDQSELAEKQFDIMVEKGKKILPTQPGAKAYALSWWREAMVRGGYPEYTGYEQSKSALISHLRALANTGRVNTTELAYASTALENANTIGALEEATGTAKQALSHAQEIIRSRGGQFGTGGAPSEDNSDYLNMGR